MTLLRAPIRSVSIFALVLGQYAWQGVDYVRLHLKTSLAFAALLALLFTLNHTPGAHTEVLLCVLWCGGVCCALWAVNITPGFLLPSSQALEEAKEVVWNGSWWVLLGILSSVGLGTVFPLLQTTRLEGSSVTRWSRVLCAGRHRTPHVCALPRASHRQGHDRSHRV